MKIINNDSDLQETKPIMKTKVDTYVEMHSKSQLSGFLLTLLFGPLGLFYSSWIAGLILTITAVGLGATIIVPLICWGLSILLSFGFVDDYNNKVKSTAELLSSE